MRLMATGDDVTGPVNIGNPEEISVATLGQINTENGAKRYHSGEAISFDADVVGLPFDRLPALAIGLQGYTSNQLTNDTVSGVPVNGNGYRGRQYGLGPQIEYDFKSVTVIAKYRHEFDVRNMPQGDRFWIELASP